MKILLHSFCLLIAAHAFSQDTSIQYELNGRPSYQQLVDSISLTSNPFAPFIGEWKLKEDRWIHNWGGQTDTIYIENHHTISTQINTENSLLSIVDGPEPNGHIYWTYNPVTHEIHHSSSFGDVRIGKGAGVFYEGSSIRLKNTFEGEQAGTYRIYTYHWLSEDLYEMKSIQYDEEDSPTGLFYYGVFERIRPLLNVEKEVFKILSILDDHTLPKTKQVEVYEDQVIHMAPNHPRITNKSDLLKYLSAEAEKGYAIMTHEVLELSTHGDLVLMTGKVTGTYHPIDQRTSIPFQTKNMFVFKRVDGELKISSVIYNHSPLSDE